MFCFLSTLDSLCHDIIKLLIIVELNCSSYHLIILKVMLIEASFIGIARTILPIKSFIMVSFHHQCIIMVSFSLHLLLLTSENELPTVVQYSYICNSIYYSSFIHLVIQIYLNNRIDRILIKKTNQYLSRDVWNTLYSILMAMILSTIADGSMTHY